MEAWDIIVIGDGPAALRASAVAAKEKASTLMMSSQSLGIGDTTALDGIAAPLKESTTKSHRDDTIRAGGFLCDQDIVSQRITEASRQVDLLERWGVIFRRDADGIPLVQRSAGHELPRLAGAGDAMVRETQQVLEEQCMKHGVVRRGDQIPLHIVHTNQQVHGLIALDLTTGIVNALQAKSIIIADGGYDGIWNGRTIGLGLDLALRTGMPVRNLEFTSSSPLTVSGTNVVLPIGMLADGATLHHPNGNPLDIEEFADVNKLASAVGENGIVLDARSMGDSSVWWSQTSEIISTRLGINTAKQTIPISSQVTTTLGGITTDEHGRAISGKWSRWFTGLYAAGDAACSGVHGAGMVAGNRLLDAMASSAAAGMHAANYAAGVNFSGRTALETYLGVAEADLDFDMAGAEEGPVQRAGPLFAKLTQIMNTHLGKERDGAGIDTAIGQLTELQSTADKLHIDDNSRLFNSNLVEALRLKAGIRLAIATAQSAKSRTESRGTHQRSDFEETDIEQMHHTLVNKEGEISSLALRKGRSGTWILPPEV